DERWVPSDHERSNQNMISNIFTPNHYNFVPFPHVGINSKVSHSTTEYNNHITEIIKNTGKNAIDIIILGMGDDGHTASLFPLNPDYIKLLGNNTETISFSTFVNEQNELRLSLSPNFIINATNRFLLISGANKGKVLNNVFKINDNKKYPIQIAFDNKTSVYLDQICYQQLELNNNS
ncbi:MAG: 6-phosphogluconolactonase, partial [Candidatus Heimdallarchaeota archaeon]|nr:6-phosphogluconolactonase [Candidatus Heimdallarchaeota archaeon]